MLAGVASWALGVDVAGAVVGVGALIVVAGDPPAWYPPAVGACGLAGLIATVGGLRLAGVARLRWRLLGLGTAAVVTVAVLTFAAG